jgi:DNA-binding transcriptional LysR family regulator
MNIDSFKIFCDLVESKSFSKAAQLNKVTQSAVSQQIRAIENRFNVLLVERNRRQFQLTREGQTFYEGSRRIFEAFETLHGEMQELTSTISGEIRISSVYSIGLHDLPAYIKAFMRKHPTVKIHVEYRRSAQVYEEILSNQADLGLVAFPNPRAQIAAEPFRKDRLVLICHPQHYFANFQSMPIRQILGHKLVGFDPDLPTRMALDKIFKSHKLNVKPVMEFDNVETLKRAVEIDAGVSIVPLSTVTQEIQNKTLKVVAFSDEEILRPLGIIFRKNKVFTPAMKKFMGILKSKV